MRSTVNLPLSPARLLADAGAPALAATLGGVTGQDTEGRRVHGLVAPWNKFGNTSAGRLAIRAGAIRLPDDLSRVKLVDDHQRPPVAVGYAIAAENRPEGLYMTFQLSRSDRATGLLAEVEDRTKDGLSVELDDLVVDGSLVTDSLLTAVAACAVPAFTDARSTLAASQPEGITLMDCTSCGQAHALTAACPTPALVASTPAAPAATATPAAPAEPVTPAAPAATASVQVTEPAPTPAAPAVQAAAAPAGLAGLATAAAPSASLQGADDSEVYAALHRVLTGTTRHPSMEAALADIINTNVYDVVGQESYVGRLWSGNPYRRRFVDLLRPGRLTSWKVRGWKWDVKPEVSDYAGDKANVPSNTPSIVPADTEAARLAGGHDLDRKFRDFGDTEFLAAYFDAMTESYAKKSDMKALAFILATAAANAATVTPAGGNLIQAALLAEDALAEAYDDEEVEADYLLVNRADRRALLEVTNNEAPAYAKDLGLDWSKIRPAASVPSGTVVAGVKAAGTFYELGDTPIRVEALDIARGGIDEAVFGYYATLLHDSRGIQRVTITA